MRRTKVTICDRNRRLFASYSTMYNCHGLTLKVEIDVCIAVSEGVERVAPVEPPVGEAGVNDGEGEDVLVPSHRATLIAHPFALSDGLE